MRFYQKIIISFLFLTNCIQAQQYCVENISTTDGLGNNCIQSIFKDSREILWVGTANGLSKIINNKIQNLSSDDGLAPVGCWAIAEDENHNMWFGNYGGGITFFDGKKFKVINDSNGLCNNYVRKLISFGNNLYAGSDNGFSVININSKKLQSFTHFESETKLRVTSLLEHNKECYIGFYSNKAGIWKLTKDKKLVKINSEPFVVSLYKTNDSIKTHSDYKFKSYSLQNFLKNTTYNTISSGAIWDYAMTNDKECFIAKLDFYNPSGGVFKILKNKFKDYTSIFNINSTQIWCLFYDKKFNQLYVGSQDKGLFIVNLNKEINYNQFNNEDIKHILKIDSTKIFISASGVYFEINNTLKNLSSITLIKYVEKFYHKQKSKIYKYNHKDFKIRKLNEIIYYNFEVYNYNLFISTSIGFFKISKSGTITSFSPIDINCFKMLGEFELIASRDYLPTIYYKDFRLAKNGEELNLKDENNPRDVFNLTTIDNRLYLISYVKGLYKYENKKSYSYLANHKWLEKALLTSCKNDKGQLIVANQKGDIYVIANSEKFQILKKIKNNEIKGNSILFLQSYKDYIIVGTNLGLNFYKNGVSFFLDEKNGLKSKIFNSAFLSKDILFIATTKGYYELNLKKILATKKQNLKLLITKMDVNYKPVFNGDLKWYTINKTAINLPYNNNTLSIEFEPKNISNKSKLIYSFKVVGLKNSNWSEWSSDTSILLPFLPDGAFNIFVQTKDLSTGTKFSQRLLSVTITPPFWKTIPFIILISIMAFLLFYLYIKNRIKKITQKNEIQKRLIETKMEALQSQMNPHFTFNAMNSIQNYIVKNKMEDALEYLVDFSRLIRQTLDNSLKSSITLAEELLFITLYVNLQNKRYASPVLFNIVTSDAIDKSKVTIPPMIIQPFIENSFIHAFTYDVINPKLELEIVVKDNLTTITIEDNGCGFEIDSIQEHSKGINLVKERIKLYNSDNRNSFEIYSKPHNGTKIIITFFSSFL